MATIEHGNPYTHEEHIRESKPGRIVNYSGVHIGNHTCGWCGSAPRVVYQYDRTKGWFCNQQCHQAYHS